MGEGSRGMRALWLEVQPDGNSMAPSAGWRSRSTGLGCVWWVVLGGRHLADEGCGSRPSLCPG